MNEQNLQPLNTKTKEEQREIARLGGLSRSPQKKLAAKLRELKKKGVTEDSAKRLYEVMTDPLMTDLDILFFLDSIKLNLASVPKPDPKAQILLSRAYLKFREIRHGSSTPSAQVNIQNNTQINVDKQYDFVIIHRNLEKPSPMDKTVKNAEFVEIKEETENDGQNKSV